MVGRADTEDLEGQVRGSRHAWDIRLISVRALFKLLDIKVKLEGPQVVQQIRSILAPQEYTRVDGIVDLVFLAAEDVATESTTLEESDEIERGVDEKKPVDFNDECVDRIAKHFRRLLVKQSRVTWKSPDNFLGLLCKTSRTYTSGCRVGYWFGFHSAGYKVLSSTQEAWVAFGCGSPEATLLIPCGRFVEWTDGLSSFTRASGESYWHIHILATSGRFQLRRKRGFTPVDLTSYRLKSSTG